MASGPTPPGSSQSAALRELQDVRSLWNRMSRCARLGCKSKGFSDWKENNQSPENSLPFTEKPRTWGEELDLLTLLAPLAKNFRCLLHIARALAPRIQSKPAGNKLQS